MGTLFGQRPSNKLWGSSVAQTRGEIDLRAEMHEILFGSTAKPQRGHWVVYRSIDLTQTTSGVYDEVYRTGVGGQAHPYTDTLVMTRRDPIFAPEQNEAQTPMGLLEGARDGYYFEYNFEPRIEDQIFEIEWSDHTVQPRLGQIPTPYKHKYNIKEVFPFRSDGGRVEYWIAFVNKDRISY